MKPGKILLLLVALGALAVGLVGYPRQAAVSTLPAGLEVPPDIFPADFGGFLAVNERSLSLLVEGFPVGQPVPLTADSGESALTIVPVAALDKSYLVVTLISGLIFWLVATLIFLPRFSQPAVPQFFWITVLYGLSVLVGGVYFQTTRAPLGLLLSLVQLTCLAFLPVVFVHLGLIFPARAPVFGRTPGVPWLLYFLAAGLVSWQGFAYWNFITQPDAVTLSRLAAPNIAADIVLVLEVVCGLGLLVRQERRLDLCRARQQVRWLLLGFMIGASPYVFLRTLPLLVHVSAPFPAYLDRLFEPAIPLAFVLAIVRYRFLEIEIILRRGVLYGVLAAVIVALTLLPVSVLGYGWARPWPWAVKLLPVVGGVIAGLVFRPLCVVLGRWIDRMFFKIQHQMDTMTREMRGQLARASGQEEIARVLHHWLEQALAPAHLLVAVANAEGTVLVGGDSPAELTEVWLAEALAGSGTGRVFSVPEATTDPCTVAPDFPAELTTRGYVLTVPLVDKEEPLGILCLGPKKSGYRYVGSDLTFLTTAGVQASRRLREIRLVQGLMEEQLARRQLDQMSQLKDEFLSRISHDLRTPVTSLGWSLRNLLDGLAGAMDPRQTKYLATMNQAVTHLDGLVTGLLEVSRLEKAEIQVVLGPTELEPVLAQAVGTVAPLAESRGIRLVPEIADGTGPVVANDAKLAEVLVNLLGNAVRYSPDGEQVTVSTSRARDLVTIIVRDHGPGFEGVSDPFARFAQGTPSPHAEPGGYGLGLTIAHEYMELLNGSISAHNHPAGGAEFRLELKAATGATES